VSEMRNDIFANRWVIVEMTPAVEMSALRFRRFAPLAAGCQFCEHHEDETPPEIFAIRKPGSPANGPGWSVRVVPSARPRLRVEGGLDRRAEGFHDLMNGIGAHEVIIETPRHDQSLHQMEAAEIANLLRACVARILDLRKDERMRYALIFKNHGEDAGAHTTGHSISQLMALPVTPRSITSKLNVARDYYAAKERCIYCDVLRQELKDQRRLVGENADFVAIAPFASRFPFEMAIFPKHHSSDFSRTPPEAIDNLARLLREVLGRLDRALGSPPYNLALQDSPRLRRKAGYWATIEQDFHWHLEILPQVFPTEGFEWASGFYYNPVSPEAAAKCLSDQ